ncbi:MAG: CopD family protein [Chloroflexi bacterium]|nr:CopD family protein [Chloroflexota bacterium]
MPIPHWALLVSFWLHMLATVVWIGGLAALALFVLPTMRRSLKAGEFAKWLTALNKRLDPIGWLSLGLLTFTGLVQMDANPNYAGFLAFSNPWSQAILLKHVAFLGMIAVSAYITWGVIPALQRSALKLARGLRDDSGKRWQNRLQQLIVLNFFLGLLVLAFTAVARTS